jgi:RNA-binding protein
MPKLNLTPHERSELRAAAHALRPVVLIGDNGLTDAVIKEITVHLQAHQLIKIRVAGDDRQARLTMLEQICDALDAAPIHHLGKILTIYRPNIERPPVLGAPVEKPTRAVRKPSEPYTPKKLAASGVQRTGKTERARRAEMQAERSSTQEKKASAAPRSVQKFSAVKPAAAPRSNTNRPGSAMSLRAGARRGLGGSGKR